MTELKLGGIADDKPVRVSMELTASAHRALVAYAKLLGCTNGRRRQARRYGSLRRPGFAHGSQSAIVGERH